MPVVEIVSPSAPPPQAVLRAVSRAVTGVLGLPDDLCWVLWRETDSRAAYVPHWSNPNSAAPVVFVTCRETYSGDQVGDVLRRIQHVLASTLGCPAHEVFIAVRRVVRGELLVRDTVWDETDAGAQTIDVRPIGFVRTERTEAVDDFWADVVSRIELDPTRFTEEAVAELDSFSHLEVVFHFHLVPAGTEETGARRPRNNPQWPPVGIFAQRAKRRPNRIGVSRCRLLGVEGLVLTVQGLDAIDGTPVLDVKPYMREFDPIGEVHQPEWSTVVMADYYRSGAPEQWQSH